ncbi:MAG TPA: hypothetical protein PKD70_14890, partial [Saprospiraceae bacterium]|nr:hypothetical protein [Saprospiraceae bacterium]HMP15163.1 hypothetical protein [Saprospiraceae bacterium]
FQMDYHSYRGGNYPPDFQNFNLENINIRKAEKIGIKIAGIETKSVQNIHLRDIRIDTTPRATVFNFVNKLSLERVQINGQAHR